MNLELGHCVGTAQSLTPDIQTKGNWTLLLLSILEGTIVPSRAGSLKSHRLGFHPRSFTASYVT